MAGIPKRIGSPRAGRAAIAVALALLTIAVFLPLGGSDFIRYDDGVYVKNNPAVRAGLTPESVAWAFTNASDAGWIPLTWLSRMLDVSLFGMDPGAHHLVNLFFHVLNAMLLFLVLSRMTGRPGRSVFVAALFAVHPFHVESVAWIVERKDVLSTFFWMLSVTAYARYVERPSRARFVPIAIFMALGLMAKPMVVTLPFVLLLLDGWPLNRIPPDAPGAGFAHRFREKIPLFLLSALSCAATVIIDLENGSVSSAAAHPPWTRIANALVSYATYAWKTVWPHALSVFYPYYADDLPAWKAAAAAAVVASCTVFALRSAGKRPWLAVGWLWFVGTLIPVIGIVQAGSQSMADRYTYIPLVGLFVAAAWGIAEPVGKRRGAKPALAASACAVVLALALACRSQVLLWRDSGTLFTHAIEVTRGNWLAHNNLANYLRDEGDVAGAIAHYRQAVTFHPDFADAHYNLGELLVALGRPAEAVPHLARAVELVPTDREAAALLYRAMRTAGAAPAEGSR